MHHFADNVVVLVVIVGEDAVEKAPVSARVIEGDIEQVYGRILNVLAPFASVPVDTICKLVILNGGFIPIVGVYLDDTEII